MKRTVLLLLVLMLACSSVKEQERDVLEVRDSSKAEDLKGDAPGEEVTLDLPQGDEEVKKELFDTADSFRDEEETEDIETPEIEDIPAPPPHLPFEFTRPQEGKPVTQEEVEEFTRKAVAFFKKHNYFQWVIWVSHGMDKSTGMPDYLVWWQDVDAVKKGDLVTFVHSNRGGAHNIMIPTSRILWSATGAYLLFKDNYASKVVQQYCKGITATMKGMQWDENDPNKYLMARNIVNHNYQIVLEGGRKKAVDYTPWYNEYQAWNAERWHYPHNPYWGDIYITNMRSKDDVCHIFRAAAYLVYLVQEATDPEVKAACEETLEYLKGFAKDIVDHNYHIRTKDKNGKPFIPKKDLASFVDYVALDPKAECDPRLTSALIAYGDTRGQDCGPGYGSIYEKLATTGHYFNYAIIVNFHLSAVVWALVKGEYEVAYHLLEGLAQRFHNYLHPDETEPGPKKNPDRWYPDVAAYLVSAAAVGLPLTNEEVHLIHEWYSKSFDEAEKFDKWDLWDESVPDGKYPYYYPKVSVGIDRLAFLFGYCASPFKNPAGTKFVDCELLSDPSKW